MADYSNLKTRVLVFMLVVSVVVPGIIYVWMLPFSITAVNLGGWLVTEGWIKPSLFDGIPNKDFLLWRINETISHLRVFNKQFIGLDTNGNGINVVSTVNTPGSSETFEIVRNSDDQSLVRIKAPNGSFLQVKTEELVTADYAGNRGWGDNDPSVFKMTFSGKLKGEFQVTNGYGPKKAPQIMKVREF